MIATGACAKLHIPICKRAGKLNGWLIWRGEMHLKHLVEQTLGSSREYRARCHVGIGKGGCNYPLTTKESSRSGDLTGARTILSWPR
ncbi:hypothetical protein FHS67_000696 [Aminobacter aminovorans]|uniref:Uncharacterized protein n=1 Tax=Aminobacter aminovorans TaxID=83263 RepID=A0ABR6H1K5_AMIAI|nr:hypothetical protein [Aminobacter aminovorans]